MNYQKSLEYIHSVSWKGSVPGLSRISALLDLMGHPEKNFKVVHVTGTNGKGSTCAMIASVLNKAGYKTGLFTSPYLIDFCERIMVGDRKIGKQTLADIAGYVRFFADKLDEADKPTEFELITAIGFEYFSRRGCDIVVCEVGMGGEFDATNVIPSPEVAVITNIGLDHTKILGDTIEKIAATKSGIIKPGCDAVLYKSTDSVEAVVRERCEKVGANLHVVDFSGIEVSTDELDGQVFSCAGFRNIGIHLLGEHQRKNACVAIEVLKVLRKRGYNISDEIIRRGLRSTFWHGRFEVVRHSPTVILDGGHNPQCIGTLVESVRKYLRGRELIILTGVLADKDYEHMYSEMSEYASEFITVTPGNPRALGARELAKYLEGFGKQVTPCNSIDEGVRLAYDHVKEKPDNVIVCYGSLYMLGDVYRAIDKYIPATDPQDFVVKK